MKMRSNPQGPRSSPGLLLDLSGQWGLSWLSPDHPSCPRSPSQAAVPASPCCCLKGNAFCSSGFRLACGLNGQSLLFVAIMRRRKGKKARALCYSRGVVFFVPLTVSWELPCTTRPPHPQKRPHSTQEACKDPGAGERGACALRSLQWQYQGNIYFEGWGLGGLGFPSLCSASVGSGLCEESGRGDAIACGPWAGRCLLLLGCRQTGAPGVPLPGQWELAQEATPVQTGVDRWGQRGYRTGRLVGHGQRAEALGRVGRRNGPSRTPSPQPAGTWGGRADGEEPCEPQRAGWERFYVLGCGKLLIMDFRLDRVGGGDARGLLGRTETLRWLRWWWGVAGRFRAGLL